jgi:hypothetical protein
VSRDLALDVIAQLLLQALVLVLRVKRFRQPAADTVEPRHHCPPCLVL